MKRRGENKNYEPIYGSDIFNQLPSKKYNPENDDPKKYDDLSYEGFREQQYIYSPSFYSYKRKDLNNNKKNMSKKLMTIILTHLKQHIILLIGKHI